MDGQVVVKSEGSDSAVAANIVKHELSEDPTEDIYRLIESQGDGLDSETLSRLTPAMSPKDRQDALNALLSQQRLDIVTAGGSVRFRVKTGTQLSGVSQEEQLIYQLIEESTTKGIWIRELRDGSGLSQIQLRKVLKQLETKKLIKAVKAVGTTRKCYMIYNLEPDTSLTGGTFYSDQQLDAELIHTLVSVCVGFIQGRRKLAIEQYPNDIQMQKEFSFVRPEEIATFVHEKRVLNVPVTEDDIDRILEVAILDGTVERRPDGRVRAAPHGAHTSALVTVPCATCPVIDDCKPGHIISPETCQYMKDWLN